MINTLRISRFKSIRELSLNCKRFNIFIGEPNTGKSNILESIGMLSYLRYSSGNETRDFVRFERLGNLFYDEVLDEPLEIQCDSLSLKLEYEGGQFKGHCSDGDRAFVRFEGDHNELSSVTGLTRDVSHFKYYRFSVKEHFHAIKLSFSSRLPETTLCRYCWLVGS